MPNLLVPNVNESPLSSTFSPPFGLWVDTDPSYLLNPIYFISNTEMLHSVQHHHHRREGEYGQWPR